MPAGDEPQLPESDRGRGRTVGNRDVILPANPKDAHLGLGPQLLLRTEKASRQ